MEIVHEPLEIAIVQRAKTDDIASFVDSVITKAISEAPGLLEAEWDGRSTEPVIWTLRMLGDLRSVRNIAAQDTRFFRPTLARINSQLLNGQLYGGAIRRVLRQEGRQVIAAIHTSNEGPTGFWIRVAIGAVSTVTISE